ncbi:MAG: hypothetical protein ACR2GH_08540 [Pseudonocardia sp.]
MSSPVDVDAVVGADGTVVVPPEVVRGLALLPGQRVRLRVSPADRRKNMYGALVGTVHEVSAEDIAAVRRAVWGELADSE